MKKISEMISDNKDLQELFANYKEKWNAHMNTKLSYSGQELEPLKVEENLITTYFIPDKVEKNSFYVISALETLADSQNQALKTQQEFLAMKTGLDPQIFMDLNPIPVQKILKDQVMNLSLINLNFCYVNNWEYDKGVEVVYDYEKLQEQIKKALMTSKFIRTDRLKLVQYPFEMLTGDNSDLISTIRETVKQEAFSADQNLLDLLERPVERRDEDHNIFLLDFHEGLEHLLGFLKQSDANPETRIHEFAKEHHQNYFNDKLTSTNALSNQPLKYIVALIELLEVKIFNYIKTNFMKKQYKDKSDSVEEFFHKQDWKDDSVVEKLRTAMLRLIIRMLVSGDIQPTQNITHYLINRSDFWEEALLEKGRKAYVERLGDIQLAYAELVYDLLEMKQKRTAQILVPGRQSGKKAGSRAQRITRSNYGNII